MKTPTKNPESAREIARRLADTMSCNCDLDNWEPETSTGHSCVCRIHKAASSEWDDVQHGRARI